MTASSYDDLSLLCRFSGSVYIPRFPRCSRYRAFLLRLLLLPGPVQQCQTKKRLSKEVSDQDEPKPAAKKQRVNEEVSVQEIEMRERQSDKNENHHQNRFDLGP